jgi:hypothetical protein
MYDIGAKERRKRIRKHIKANMDICGCRYQSYFEWEKVWK